MSYGNFEQGFYHPVNTEKYIGKGAPVYRSSWEKRTMFFFDNNKYVIKWASEQVIIPYHLPPEIDPTQKLRRYFTDFYVQIVDVNGNIQKYLVEVKPKKQSLPPVEPKRNTTKTKSRYKREVLVYITNQAKWKAAIDYCNKKGYKFKVLTEEDIFKLM